MKKLTLTDAACQKFIVFAFTSLTVLLINGCSSGTESTNDRTVTENASSSTSLVNNEIPSSNNSTVEPVLGEANSEPDSAYFTISNAIQSIGPVASAMSVINPSTVDSTANAENSSKTILLAWEPASVDDLGYYVYYSSDSQDAYILARQVTLTPDQYQQSHKIKFNSKEDLYLSANDSVCFTVSAWNASGESSRSAPKCIQIPS